MNRLTLAVLLALPFAAGCGGPLASAIKAGNLEGVNAAIPGSGFQTTPGFAGQACIYNQPEVLKMLVEKGSALEENSMIASALTHCVMHNRVEMTRFLLSRGVAISSRDVKIARSKPQIQALLQAELARRAGQSAPAAATAYVPPAPAAHRAAATSDIDSPARRGGERPNDFALLIGIDEYQALPKAEFGVRDAQTVRKHFEAIGVPARNIISLEGSQATGSKLKSYLQQWLPRNVKPESTLFVYYSGHGAPNPANGDAYLVPWDTDPMFLETSAYPLKQFYAELAALKAKRVLVALDACFSGGGGRSVLAKGARPLVAKVDESVPVAANLTVIAAASGSEITGTLDDQAHGMFTYYFLKGLSGGAKTPRALYDYLKPKVQDDARRQNREQSPTLMGAAADSAF